MLFADAAGSSGGGVSLWLILIPAIVTLGGTAATFYAARYSAKKAGETDTIKLGVTELVDQLRAERSHFQNIAEECEGRCDELEEQVNALRQEVGSLITKADNQQAEIIRLKIKAGEPLG